MKTIEIQIKEKNEILKGLEKVYEKLLESRNRKTVNWWFYEIIKS